MEFFLGMALVLLLLEVLRSAYILRVNEVEIPLDTLPSALDGLRIVHITDLHSKSFGKQNEKLAHFIRHHHPDVIFATGDMMETTPNSTRAFCQLLEKLNGKYPVYFSPGNHELRQTDEVIREEMLRCCTERGAVPLENDSAVLQRNETAIRLYGYAPAEWGGVRSYGQEKTPTKADMDAVLGEKDKAVFSILLAHNPDGFPGYARWGADLTLSGHIHGGLWRPFGVGIFSPTRRFFPKYSAGLYDAGDIDISCPAKLFVSTGLSGAIIPRLWNPPEIAVLTLRSGQPSEKGQIK